MGELESSYDLSEKILNPIKGLHTLCQSSDTLGGATHIVTDEKANSFTVDNETGKCDTLFKLKGSHVSKTYMLRSNALTSGSVRTSGGLSSPANLLSVLSKDTPM